MKYIGFIFRMGIQHNSHVVNNSDEVLKICVQDKDNRLIESSATLSSR